MKPKRAEYSGRKLLTRVILGFLGAALIAVGIVALAVALALVLRDSLQTLSRTNTIQVISEIRYIQNGRQYHQI